MAFVFAGIPLENEDFNSPELVITAIQAYPLPEVSAAVVDMVPDPQG